MYDPRVDLYGLGATLYFTLTGAAPHESDSLAELAARRCSTDAPALSETRPGISRALAHFVARCLSRDPGERYASAALALWALDNPERERGFYLHRQRNPPCLQCERPIPDDSERCPACGSAFPFSFEPGDHQVFLLGLEHASALVDYVTARFPERCSESECVRLRRISAGLRRQRLRYVGRVSRRQADRIVASLQRAGIWAERSQMASLVWAAAPWVAAPMIMDVDSPIAGFGLALPLGASALMFASMARAPSVLTTRSQGFLIAPKTTRVAFAAAVVISSMTFTSWVYSGLALASLDPARTLLPSLASWAVWGAFATLRFGGSRLPENLRCEPTVVESLHTRLPDDADDPEVHRPKAVAAAPGLGAGRASRALGFALALIIVIAELVILGNLVLGALP